MMGTERIARTRAVRTSIQAPKEKGLKQLQILDGTTAGFGAIRIKP